MNKYFLCILLLASVWCKHTDIYKEYMDGSFTKTLFLEYTYLGNDVKTFDPCTPIDYDTGHGRYIFIGILESSRKRCSGDWCDDNGGYGCGENKRECYQVEHIIDRKKSKPYVNETYSRDILGNLIMAYGLWNTQMGYSSMTWEDVQNEKIEIYSNFIFKKALEYIENCATNRFYYDGITNISDTSQNNPSISKKILVIFSMIMFMFFCLIASLLIHKYIFFVEKIKEKSPELSSVNV